MFRTMTLAAIAALTACTTMAPGAKEVTITHDPNQVAHCTAKGPVSSSPPYVLPNDDLKQLKNQAVAVGADTVLITGPRIVSTAGVAYRCAP